MAAAPSVCITVPFHCDLDYLEQALRSLLAQTDPDWTAIVVDDAGPQPAIDLVEAIADPRIRCVRNATNLGVAGNFNRCLDLGSGSAEVVAIVHADDVLEADFVAAVRRAHNQFPDAAMVATRVTVIDEVGRPTRTLGDSVKRWMWPRDLPFTLSGDRGLGRIVNGLFLYCPAVSYRMDRVAGLRFDERWRQVMDLDLFARALLANRSLVLVPNRVYRYRRHAGSMSARNARAGVRRREEVAVTREIVAAAHERGWRRTVVAGRMRITVRINALLARLAAARGPR